MIDQLAPATWHYFGRGRFGALGVFEVYRTLYGGKWHVWSQGTWVVCDSGTSRQRWRDLINGDVLLDPLRVAQVAEITGVMPAPFAGETIG